MKHKRPTESYITSSTIANFLNTTIIGLCGWILVTLNSQSVSIGKIETEISHLKESKITNDNQDSKIDKLNEEVAILKERIAFNNKQK